MSYKVGDVVVIKKCLSLSQDYDGCAVVGDMPKLCGNIATIIWANGEGNKARYKIRGNSWFWSNSMFEGLADDLNGVPVSLDVFSVL